ncbi:MAG: hypothetical protein ACR2HR_00410 [Euzebya sp.]
MTSVPPPPPPRAHPQPAVPPSPLPREADRSHPVIAWLIIILACWVLVITVVSASSQGQAEVITQEVLSRVLRQQGAARPDVLAPPPAPAADAGCVPTTITDEYGFEVTVSSCDTTPDLQPDP